MLFFIILFFFILYLSALPVVLPEMLPRLRSETLLLPGALCAMLASLYGSAAIAPLKLLTK